MFSERLEKLIQSSLQDGILTDQEKAAIIKRAKAEGEDIDEVEIYIDSLLQKRQKELNNSAVKKQAKTSSMDELKKLIDATMADGIITSKEREVITRKAAALGMDADEVDVYLDAEIQKAELAADVAKRDKLGKVCPKCGEQVPPLTIKCVCGYEFTNEKHESSVKLLSEKIGKIQSRQLKGKPDTSEWETDKKLRDQEMLDAISLFPVPNTKEDIVEFLSLAAPNARQKGGFFGTVPKRLIVLGILAVIIIFVFYLLDPPGHGKDSGMLPLLGGIYVVVGAIAGAFLIDKDTLRWNKSATVWRAKFEQVLMKGRSLRGDSEFTQQLDYYESMLNKK